MPRSEPDHLVDANTAAAYVTHLTGRHCAPGTIWSWATRGHIGRYGRGRYDIREIDAWIRADDRMTGMTDDLSDLAQQACTQPTVEQIYTQLQSDRAATRSAARQCSGCGSYRADGQPPVLHRDGCPDTASER